MTAAVILAAGASSRMGSPKALLPLDGETFLTRLARMFQTLCDGPVVVVLGYQAEAIRPAVPAGVTIVINPDPSRGMLSSLQCGLAGTLAAGDVFFTPVDSPAIQPATIARLKSTVGEIVIPRYNGERGHPVRISAAVRDEILALPPTAKPHDVIRAHSADHVYVDVDDPGVTFDVDDPDAFARLGSLWSAARGSALHLNRKRSSRMLKNSFQAADQRRQALCFQSAFISVHRRLTLFQQPASAARVQNEPAEEPNVYRKAPWAARQPTSAAGRLAASTSKEPKNCRKAPWAARQPTSATPC